MGISILNERDYYRTVYGGWLGKNIGGTLGAPVEGKKQLLDLTFYPKLSDGPLENDDLDLQLVWLHALEQYGPGLTSRELGQEWEEHVFFPFDEYGYALANLRRGLIPPAAGAFNNPFANCMGSPIRSEIWAMAAPGLPEAAAYYAYQDASVDHAGGEGVYGEMFFASLESAIFFEKDRDRLIETGLKHIPPDCRTAKALRDLIRWHQEGKTWIEARQLILEHHGNDNFTDAPQNIAFTILGWLYGENFEDAILKAVNCGYDTDCTAATLGAILGMLLGPDQLPEKWVAPVGDRVVVSPPIKGFPAPKNLDELTLRTIRMGKKVLAEWDAEILVHPELPTSWSKKEVRAEAVKPLWEQSVTANRYLLPEGSRKTADAELVIEFGPDGPAVGPGQTKTVRIAFANRSKTALSGTLKLRVPAGWAAPEPVDILLQPEDSYEWDAEIRAGSFDSSSAELAVIWTRTHNRSVWAQRVIPFSIIRAAKWTVWGPGDADKSGDKRKAAAGTDVFFPGNRIGLEKVFMNLEDGVYRARTKLHNPSERDVRLIAAANAPVKLKLNGETLIDCQETLPFMPAFHRANAKQLAELKLAAGSHEVEVETVKNGRPVELYILAVSTRQTASPGAFYYYTDLIWGSDG